MALSQFHGDRPARAGRTAAARLARAIEHEIVRDGWQIGRVIGSEEQLLERFGVGRTVLREAARILESIGVAKRKPGPGGGLIVTAPDAAAVLDASRMFLDFRRVRPGDLYDAWLALELLAVRQLAERIDDAGRESLRKVLAEEEAYLGEPGGYRSRVHGEIVRLAGNPVIELFVEVLNELAVAHGPEYLSPEDAGWVKRSHAGIVDAIAAGDAGLAEYRLRRYFRVMMDAPRFDEAPPREGLGDGAPPPLPLPLARRPDRRRESAGSDRGGRGGPRG